MKLSPWPEQRKRASRSRLKQIQVYLQPADWLKLRRHAASQHRPLTDVVRALLRPAMDALPETPEVED